MISTVTRDEVKECYPLLIGLKRFSFDTLAVWSSTPGELVKGKSDNSIHREGSSGKVASYDKEMKYFYLFNLFLRWGCSEVTQLHH